MTKRDEVTLDTEQVGGRGGWEWGVGVGECVCVWGGGTVTGPREQSHMVQSRNAQDKFK